MTKVTYNDFIEKLKHTNTTDLLYNLVEAKIVRHIDILSQVPAAIVIKAEEAIIRLVAYCKTIEDA